MGRELVDLSHVVQDGLVTYPGLPAPRITEYLSLADSRAHYAPGTEFRIGRIDLVGNTGTYLDTPSHRYADGHDLADLPLSRVADLPGICVAVPHATVGPESFDDIDVTGRAVLVATGWDRHWSTQEYGAADHPHLTAAAADVLASRGAVLVGIDSVNIDDTRTGERPVHTTLLAAEVPVVEHLTGLLPLAGTEFRFFAVPVKVRGMATFPVRAFAIVEE
jgi:arylformamidase